MSFFMIFQTTHYKVFNVTVMAMFDDSDVQHKYSKEIQRPVFGLSLSHIYLD